MRKCRTSDWSGSRNGCGKDTVGEPKGMRLQYRYNSIISILLILVLITLFFLEFGTGHINNVVIKTEESKLHSEEEIEEAANVLKYYFFLHMPGFELRELSYREENICSMAEELLEKGKIKSIDDFIVFESVHMKIHDYKGSASMKVEKSGYRWVIIRDSAAGPWKVDASLCR